MFAAPRRRHLAVLSAAVLISAGAACGGDDDSSDDRPETTASAATSAAATTVPLDTTEPTTEGTTEDTIESTTDDTTESTTDDTTELTTEDTSESTSGDTSEDSAPASGNLELIDAGSEDGRIQLPGTASVGDTGSGSATVNVDVTGFGEDVSLGVVMRYDAEIVEADDDGYVSETTITEAEVLDAPADADLSTFEGIVGVTFNQSFSNDGRPGEIMLANEDELTDEQIEAFEQFGSSINSAAALAFPTEPVGVGARWTSTTSIESQGIEFAVDYQYELTEVNGSDYVLALTYDEDLDTEVEQGGQTAQLTGTITGTGSVDGSTEDLLSNSTELVQDLDFTIDAGSESLDVQVNVEVLLENQ
jgi:hypothetical protein